MSRAGRRVRASGAALFAAVTVLVGLTACSGVPSSSRPQVVQSVAVGPQPPVAVIRPQHDADARAIVSGFLQANASDDERHLYARAFLTPQERNRWTDVTATIVDRVQVGNPRDGTVTVSGTLVGTLDANGDYTPSLPGNGTGSGAAYSVPFGLSRIGGQWRINSIGSNGLVITLAQFQQVYTQRVVYYFDQSDQHLVPELRYTAQTDPSLLDTWLAQLASQPGPTVSTALPAQQDVNQISATAGAVVRVSIPGAGQLSSQLRNLMAEQIALTLAPANSQKKIVIVDSGRPVLIPKIGTNQFTGSDFAADVSPPNDNARLYFVYDGGVSAANGKRLAGPIGSSHYDLTSVALATSVTTSGLLVAGVSGTGKTARLLTGQTGGPLKPTTVTGALTRPSWVPNLDEVWVSNGTTLYRVGANRHGAAVPLTAASGDISGRILAVRVSPEGARVALVIQARGGSSQVWVGTIVRAPQSVRLAGLTPISPLGVQAIDVAWNGPLKLFVIGRRSVHAETGVYDVNCDGSLWSARGTSGLPPSPDSITVQQNVNAAVSVGQTIWVQRAGTWVSPEPGTTHGTNPVYVE